MARDSSAATWTAGTTEQRRPKAEPALLTVVRTGRHKGFDRAVFVFRDHLPGYRIEYVGHPVHACGSGKPVALAGEGRLRVRFDPARAYTQNGGSTIEDPERTPGLPVLKELEMTCSGFEADVTWTLGLADSTRYRVRNLTNPPRLVVDMRHP